MRGRGLHMVKFKSFIKEEKTLAILILFFILASIFVRGFFSRSNLINVLIQVSIYGITACGMTFAIISGEFDLSVGSTMAITGLLCVVLEPYAGQVGAIILALLVAALIGLCNGILIAKFHISSFIVTIGMQYIVKGIALRISNGKPVASSCPWFQMIGNTTIAGVPAMVIIMLICVLISAYVLRQTRFGRNVYTIGGNREVAHYSGIKVVKDRTIVFVIASVTAGIAGLLNASRLNTGSASHGDNLALSVITGTVIGGTSLSGGVGGMGKTMSGILLLNFLSNALDIVRVYSYYQTAIRGLLLIAIIAMEAEHAYKANSY